LKNQAAGLTGSRALVKRGSQTVRVTE